MATAPTETRVLKTALGNYPHTRALKDGTVEPDGLKLEYTEYENIIHAFPGVMKDRDFQVSEMAITTYLLGRAFGRPYTAIPVVVARNFHHYAIAYNNRSGIREPRDLEGKRVGVRAYTVTQGVWVRGILQSEYGVDPGSITWVTFEPPHVREFPDPPNVTRAPERRSIAQMLAAGEIDAGIGAGQTGSPDVRPLFPDAQGVQAEWYRKYGIYPVNHTVMIRNDILAESPWVAPALFRALQASKEIYLERLRKEGPSSPEDENRLRIQQLIGGDPLPYGVEPNRRGFETLIEFAHQQGIIPDKPRLDEIFAANTLDL